MSETYRTKLRTAAEAAALMRPRDVLCVPLGPGQPGALLEALGARDDFEDLAIFGALLLAPYAVLFKPGVRVLSGFYGPVERVLRDQVGFVVFVSAVFCRFVSSLRLLAVC